MSIKNINSQDLCTLPSVVLFEFREEQEMHSEIIIKNLVDRLVNFKVWS